MQEKSLLAVMLFLGAHKPPVGVCHFEITMSRSDTAKGRVVAERIDLVDRH